MASFSLKLTESFNGQEFSTWVQVQAWSELAEEALSLKQGMWVLVSGKLGGHKEGDKWRTCVVARTIESFEGPSLPEPDHNDANENAPW